MYVVLSLRPRDNPGDKRERDKREIEITGRRSGVQIVAYKDSLPPVGQKERGDGSMESKGLHKQDL